MLTNAGVKLLDFGIAELHYPGGSVSESVPRKERMTSQTTSGTLAYMAPEQFEGGETDARTDIFAFGVLTNEMITGHSAFQAGGHQGLVVPQPGSALDGFIARWLARHPSERWQSISDVLQMLKQIKQLDV
jgi:eukaryotic-like serine/threonine-protein kinase